MGITRLTISLICLPLLLGAAFLIPQPQHVHAIGFSSVEECQKAGYYNCDLYVKYGSGTVTDIAGTALSAVPPLNALKTGLSVAGSVAGSALQTVATSVILPVLSYLLYWIAVLCTNILGVVAWVFDAIVPLSLNSTAYALGFLTTSWGIVLNLANMFFIFILIYLAFVIMLRAETTRTMQTLAWVVAIALVVNFSFFFTRVVIDAGNILAVWLYNGITSLQVIANAQPWGGKTDITAGIMNAVGFFKLMGTYSFAKLDQLGDAKSSFETLIYISTILVSAILIVALAAAAIKFLVRIVGLWFVLIASPVAFVSKTLHQTQHFFDSWFRALIGFSFYPAIFLFMFYILTLVSTGLGQNDLLGQISSLNSSSGTASVVALIGEVVIRLGFMVALLFVGLKIADWITEAVGGLSATLMGKVSSTILGGGFRAGAATGAWALRNTAGRGAQRFAESSFLRGKAQQTGVAGSLWRGVLGTSGWTARKTFDVRNAPGGGLISKTLGVGNIDVGKATTKTFTEQEKKRTERKIAFGEKLKPSKTQIEKEQEAIIKAQTPAQQQALANAAKAYDNAKKKVDEVGDAESRRELKAAKQAFDRMMKPINDEVEKRTGAGNVDSYAQSITTPKATNLWMPSKTAYEAAAKLRDSKNKGGNVLATLKKVSGTKPEDHPVPPGYRWNPETQANEPIPEAQPQHQQQRQQQNTQPQNAPTIISPSDVAPNRLSDEERARRLAPNQTVVGPGGSAFDTRTMQERIAAESNPERRAQLEEDFRLMQEDMRRTFSDVGKAVSEQRGATEKLASAVDHLAQSPKASTQHNAVPYWKPTKQVVSFDEKTMDLFKKISRDVKNLKKKSEDKKDEA